MTVNTLLILRGLISIAVFIWHVMMPIALFTPTHSMARSVCQQRRLIAISQQAVVVHSGLGYHDYEGIALNPAEQDRLVNDLGSNNFLMLRNHGLLTVGKTVADAFLFMYVFEAACAVQTRTSQNTEQLVQVPSAIIEGIKGQTEVATKGLGGIAWPALLRLLDNKSPVTINKDIPCKLIS